MALANACAKVGRGDLVWMSYVRKGKKTTKIGHGSHLIAVTKAGCSWMQARLEACTDKPYHFDLWLLSELQKRDPGVKAGYLIPAMGGFVEHESGCQKGLGVREQQWKVTQSGTRKRFEKDYHRKCARFNESGKGWAEVSAEIVLPDRVHQYRWYTMNGSKPVGDAMEVAGEPSASGSKNIGEPSASDDPGVVGERCASDDTSDSDDFRLKGPEGASSSNEPAPLDPSPPVDPPKFDSDKAPISERLKRVRRKEEKGMELRNWVDNDEAPECMIE